MIGIKLFILYQKGVKSVRRIKDQLVVESQLALTSLSDSLHSFKKNFVVRQTCLYIDLGWVLSKEIFG